MDNTTAQDDRGREHRQPGTTRLLVIVCVAGAAVGAFFGSFAYPVGTALGGLGGVLAGLLWTRIMLRRARAGYGRGRLIHAGAGWGIVVGLIATVVLHGGLILLGHAGVRVTSNGNDLEGSYALVLVVAAACAVIGGAATGAVCGGMVPTK